MESDLCCGLLQSSCYTMQCVNNVGSVTVCWSLKLCCEILLLLNMVDMGRLLCEIGLTPHHRDLWS